ncbi:MAG: hypothetical protein JSW04_14995 [Desulfobacterales bacterium]|nr:MAG: hypothetical protein JSW04_14995 [Desulfobacterales bacterium]
MDDEIQPKNHEDRRLTPPEIGAYDPQKKNRFFEFIKDFITGVGALVVIGLILFIIIPVLLLIFKVSLALIIPISLCGAFIILIALFGKLIRHLFKKR